MLWLALMKSRSDSWVPTVTRAVPRSLPKAASGDDLPAMSELPGYQRLFADLKRRRVFRVMAVYGAVSFAVIEAADVHATPNLLTESQMRDFERENTRSALRRCHGKLYGKDGAAHLLGVSPTTLASRIKKMGLVPDA